MESEMRCDPTRAKLLLKSQPSSGWVLGIMISSVVVAAWMLFTALGSHALWDDEAVDGLMGEAVIQTGDTGAMVGHNIMAYRNGFLLNNHRVEGQPPFVAFAAAYSMRLFGRTAWAARLPVTTFAFLGFLLLLWWIWKASPSPIFVVTLIIGILCNVSLFLYSRQCHYYGIAIFCFIAIPFLYFNWGGRKLMLLLMGVCSAILLANNYSFFLAFYACLFADYMIWQRKVRTFSLSDLALIVLPPFLIGLALIAWWNPFHTQIGHRFAPDSLVQRITLFFWHWRDLNRCEMLVGLLLIIAPLVAFICRDTWLKRSLFAMCIYVIGMTILSIQPISETSVSDVRYFSALIPLFIFIEALTIRNLTTRASWLAIPLAVVAFGTNLLNGGPFLPWGTRSSIMSFADELIQPAQDPYQSAAEWIRYNIPKDASIWVVPDNMVYPLMFHAPDAVYAWQLNPEQKEAHQFKDLPPIHFKGVTPPDFIVVFGPQVLQIRNLIQQWSHQGENYQQVCTINTFWKDLYRPELFWRTFKPITSFDINTEGVYIFKHLTIP